MANTKQTKKYLGGWDTSAYDEVINAAQQAYQTNWDILRNRYNDIVNKNNLKDELNRQTYAKSLANQLQSTLETQNAVERNLANRGLGESGLRQLILRDQLDNNGSSANTALSTLLDTGASIASNRLSGLSNLLGSGRNLDTNQASDLLGIESQRVADDLQGQQLAAQIAENDAQRASSKASKTADEKYQEQLRKNAIFAILNNIDPDTGEPIEIPDNDKAFILANYYGVSDAYNIVKNYGVNSDILLSSLDEVNRLKRQADSYKTTGVLENLTGDKSLTNRRLNNLAQANKNYNSALQDYNTIRKYYNMTPQEYYKALYTKRD